jgi:hypothetical protein
MSDLTSPPPSITPRDLSYHEAQAGIAAREAAAAAGGDPSQLRALVGAAQAEEAGRPMIALGNAGLRFLKNLPLRGDDLLVSLCFLLHAKVFGADPRQQLAIAAGGKETVDQGILQRRAIAALALIFTQPDTAYDLLDRAADPDVPKDDAAGWARDFQRSSIEFAGTFTAAEIQTLGEHVIEQARRQGSAEEGGPGK